MSEWNPNNILSDAYVDGYDSKFDVQAFLEKRKSPLASIIKGGHHVSVWVANACKQHNIDTRLVLLRFQVEQSLIQGGGTGSLKRLDYALGFGASDSGKNPAYRGIDKQIEASVLWWREHFDHCAKMVGKHFSTLDYRVVTPENRATACHYLYTPWVGDHDYNGNKAPFGNRLVWEVLNVFKEDFGGH